MGRQIDPRFGAHNAHLEAPEAFDQLDPHLRFLKSQPLVHRFSLMDRLPFGEPGVYSITGGRQVGKTTLMKQWMAELLKAGVAPERIAYLTGELINDHQALVRLLQQQLGDTSRGISYLCLDEVTYIRDWDRGVKFLADTGVLADVVLLLSGSDSVIIQEARMRLPGRRGRSDLVDFHLFPLTFHEVVALKGVFSTQDFDRVCNSERSVEPRLVRSLLEVFHTYLLHGGYLTAINDFEKNGTIGRATLATYSDWIRGDALKRGKRESYLAEVLGAVVKRYGSQVTWNALAKDLSIDHPATVADYIELLAGMDVLMVQAALRQDTVSGAPKKARKVAFSDAFVFHAIRSWLDQKRDPFAEQIQPLMADPEWLGKLTEGCAASHYRRFFSTYYVKGEGEVDIAYVRGRRFWPVEIKWSDKIRPKDLKQIMKYPNGLICTRADSTGEINGVPTEPLPLTLIRLGPSPVAKVTR